MTELLGLSNKILGLENNMFGFVKKKDYELHKVLGIDTSNMPDAYDIQFIKFVQARKHKKRRINKKWLKRYGYKQISVESKGWKMKADTDGNVEFVK